MTRHWTTRYVGRPYAPHGNNGGAADAFDCWGLFRHVQRQEFGREIPEVSDPGKLSKLLRTVSDAAAQLAWRKIEKPERPASGDGVLMAHLKHPSHIGIWVADVEDGAVLHAVSGSGVILTPAAMLRLHRCTIFGIYRPESLPGVRMLEVPARG